ncbi:MAG: hypothetical protein U5L04_12225 [Trueperaceae bacterium]|nr:hypothetical protein [Trueperaceae bacterium]
MPQRRTRFEDLRELADEVAALRAEVAEFRALLQEKRDAEAAANDEAQADVAPTKPAEESPAAEAPAAEASATEETSQEPAEAPAEEVCDEKELLAAINNPNGCMAKLERIVGARQVNKRSLLEAILEAKAEQPEGRFDDYEQVKEAVKGLGDRTMAALRRRAPARLAIA